VRQRARRLSRKRGRRVILFSCLFGLVGLLLLVGGGEYAKNPPGGGRPLPRAFGWWLRLLGAVVLAVAVVSIVKPIVG
jgi:drug/metabolite transporter (DMT)-like permease